MSNLMLTYLSSIGHFFENHPWIIRFEEVPSENCDSAWNHLPPPLQRRNREKTLGNQLKGVLQEDLKKQGVPSDRVRISLSHTHFQNCHRLLMVGSDHSVGADLEEESRPVSDAVFNRIVHESEKKFPLSALEFWVIKEAAFKANSRNAGSVLPQYQVAQWNQDEGHGEVIYQGEEKSGLQPKFKVMCRKEERWWIAVARECVPSALS
jgi:phosphopantetheinyl transferase (holo-ACP synthase)